MHSLMEQGGFPSVAAQWANSALLLLLYLLVTRHAENRRAYGAWLKARVSMLAAITVIMVWYYVLPAMQGEFFARIRGGQPFALALYLTSKALYWTTLALGISHMRDGPVAPRWTARIVSGTLLVSAIAMGISPRLETATWLQALIAIPALGYGIYSLGHLPKARTNFGSTLMRVALSLQLVVWVAYAVAFSGNVFGLSTATESPFALFWLANAYTDTLLDSFVTFSMLVVLIEGAHHTVERATRSRIERVNRQQAQVVALVKMPEIAAGLFPEVSRAAARCAADALEVERVSVWMFGESREELLCSLVFERTPEKYSIGPALHSSELPIYFAALEAETFIDAHDARRDTRTAELCEPYLRDHGIGAMLDVKIRGTKDFVGVLCHEHVGGPRTWHDDEIAFAGFLADQLGQTLANHRAREAEHRRDELEAQLRHSQKLEAVGQLAGGIAHDFNNMLCAITGYASLAQLEAPANLRENLTQITAASARASELTKKLLSFSRRQVLSKSVAEANDIVRDTIELVRRVAKESIDIVVDLSPDAGRVFVDTSELEQVLLNICNNACDAMPMGGCLTVSTRMKKGSGAADAADPEDQVSIMIADTGTGIAPEVQDRIFEPFFTTKREGEGTGLGLATSYGIVDQHGGKIRVESNPSSGTVFEVTLPAVTEPATQPNASPRETARGGSELLLVVEDAAAVRTLMDAVLDRAGYEVLQAEDGAIALELFSAHQARINAVLLDSVLPKVSGSAVLEQIRAVAPGIPVICTSGYLGATPSAGFDHVLSKPFTSDQLLAAVRTVLDTTSLRA